MKTISMLILAVWIGLFTIFAIEYEKERTNKKDSVDLLALFLAFSLLIPFLYIANV